MLPVIAQLFGGRVGGPELIIILVVILLLFGARKLPDLARSLGQSAREFRKGVQDAAQDDDEEGTSAESAESSES